MGEVVVSSEDVKTDIETEKGNVGLEGNKTTMTTKKPPENSSASGELMKWGRFLPGMALRVLLVEADDSTRQIIAALLRKCSYRVTAVTDGLKAWEMLKGKPHSIDLILTEVDLPSISGFALLTLTMEHEASKSIPVIMMSSQDSISTVYKCMLRGAADYLVKPLRRNELRNLWQHVWRRQSSIVGGNFLQEESVGQKKVEATSENNPASNHSSGNLTGIQRNKEQTEKGSDAQSSCTKPDMEVESAHMENMQEFSQLIKGKHLSNESQKHEAHSRLNQKLLIHEMGAGGADGCKDSHNTSMNNGVELEGQRRNAIISVEDGDAVADSPREAIDFMGTFNKSCNSSLINCTRKFDSPPYLDLSLRRCNLNTFENHVTKESPVLWHPNSSAFTRYTSRLSQPPHSTFTSVSDQKKESQPLHSTLTSGSDQKKESGANSEKLSLNMFSEYNSDNHIPTQSSQRTSMIPSTTGASMQLNQTETAASSMQQRVFPVPLPVQGIRLNKLCDGYNSVTPPIFCAQSSSSPVPSPNSADQKDPAICANLFRHSSFESKNTGTLYDRVASNTNQSTNQPLHKPEQNLDSVEDRGHISSTTDQSASSSFCNGSLSQLNSVAYGNTGASNCNIDLVSTLQAPNGCRDDENFPGPCGNSQRSIQREAALTKFRLKRKDRCFEKKVRYESRKKLAEQRPRVKGQFVRQVQADPRQAETPCYYGNLSDC